MIENRKIVIPWIFEDEGGFVIRSTEPGGAGNMGISFEVFASWRHLQGMPEPTFDDLRDMQADEAEAIYDKQFLDYLKFDELPNATDYAVLDSGVNLGPTGSIRLLQDVLGVEADGHFGVVTLAAISKRTADEAGSLSSSVLPLAICDAWLAKKQENTEEWPEWGNGWTHRRDKVHARLTQMLGGTGV